MRRALPALLATALWACQAVHPEVPDSDPGPYALRCTATSDPPPPPLAPPGPVVVAGEPSYQMTMARRYLDWEQWQRAEVAFSYITVGDTGDDAGNRQLATFWRAVALFQLRRHDESADLFVSIALDPSHLMFRETLVWLSRLSIDATDAVPPLAFARYTDADLAAVGDSLTPEAHARLLFLLGRSRFALRDYASARHFFDRMPPSSADTSVGRECSRLAALALTASR